MTIETYLYTIEINIFSTTYTITCKFIILFFHFSISVLWNTRNSWIMNNQATVLNVLHDIGDKKVGGR